MRVAILADIHGNLHALEAVLADIERQMVDQVIINGDLVNRGPNNVAVMERVTQGDYQLILGNHDDLMRKWVERDPDLPPAWFEDPFWEGTAWCARQLERAGWIDALKALPMTRRIEPEDGPVVLVSHGSPRHYREGYSSFLTDEAIGEIVEAYPADILVGSHTHRPMERAWGKYQVLNTGAVGTPFNGDPRAQYLLLMLQEGAWQPEFRAVPYDRQGALEMFASLGYLAEGGLSAEIFFQECRCARSFLLPFWEWADQQGLEKTAGSWEQFRRTFPERFRAPEEISS